MPRFELRNQDYSQSSYIVFVFFLLFCVLHSRTGKSLILHNIKDRDLILRARNSDVQAYNILVSRWEKKIYNYFLRSIRDRDDALELSQETFLKAYRGIHGLKEIDRFPQWLFRIAHNEVASLLRRGKLATTNDELELAVDTASLPRTWLGGSGYGSTELGFLIEQALGSLTSQQKQVVLLKVYQGFKFDEIARILDCPVSTVKSRLYNALDVLKNILAPVSA